MPFLGRRRISGRGAARGAALRAASAFAPCGRKRSILAAPGRCQNPRAAPRPEIPPPSKGFVLIKYNLTQCGFAYKDASAEMADPCSMPSPDRPTPVKQVFWGRNFRLDIGRLFLFEIRQDAVMPAYFENDNALKSASPLDGVLRMAMFSEKKSLAQCFKNGNSFKAVNSCAAF